MTTSELVNYAKAHSFPAWSDDERTIHVVFPWVRRAPDGSLVTGHDVECVPATFTDLRSLIAREVGMAADRPRSGSAAAASTAG